jgi:hypothetical protein
MQGMAARLSVMFSELVQLFESDFEPPLLSLPEEWPLPDFCEPDEDESFEPFEWLPEDFLSSSLLCSFFPD